MAPTQPEDRIVVGIDFGTTMSGVAFAYSAKPEAPDDMHVVKNWPGANNVTSDKVPSELAYGHDGTVKWGYEIKPEQERLKCLKLLLETNKKFPSWATRETLDEQLRKCSKTAVDAVADYIKQLHKHTRAELAKTLGSQMTNTTQIQYVLTVPAGWSDAAKAATLKAAKKAGMGSDFSLISEPEAAIIYALRSSQLKDLKVGDIFIICDAGGGTVDLIACEVKQLSPLRLEESAMGIAELCGSRFLNMRFEELVKSRVGQDKFNSLRQRKPKAFAIAMKYFDDYVKRNFDPASSQEEYDDSKYNVPFPGVKDNPAAGIDCRFFILSTADVAEIHRPVIQEVLELVEKQKRILGAYEKIARGLFLVGGFGQSGHLFKTLRSTFAEEDPPPTYQETETEPVELDPTRFIIMQPANAWTAVVRGAVLSGIEGGNLITSRKSRRHYGVVHSSTFDPRWHSERNKYWDVVRKEWGAKNQIWWYIKREQTGTNSIALVYSDAETAPKEHDTQSLSRSHVLCTLHVDMSRFPKRRWRKRTKNGNGCYQLDFDLGMQIESGGLAFDLRIDEKVYGKVTASFD